MRSFRRLCLLVAFAYLFCACTVNLPFNNRLSYERVTEAKTLSQQHPGPIALRWMPPEFPDRVDVHGASGFVGGGSRTRVPTGTALAGRITEALDAAIGIDRASTKLLVIYVDRAESNFQYSAGFLNVTPGIDRADCILEATFRLGSAEWKEEFTSHQRDPSVGATSQTAMLERAWDDIALQVTRSVVAHSSTLPHPGA